MAAACLIFGMGCTAAESTGDYVIGSNHRHSPDILSITVVGRVTETGKKIGVTAGFSESESRLERLSIAMPGGKSIEVPRSYLEKIQLPQEGSLSLAYSMGGDSKSVAGVWVFLDFGEPRRRADLECGNDRGDPVFQSFTLFYDAKARTFRTTIEDYCGEPIPG
jgi:hypothetical protein